MLKQIIENIMKEKQEKMEQEIPRGLKNAIEDIQAKIKKENNSDVLEGTSSFKNLFDNIYSVSVEFTSYEFKEKGVRVIKGEVNSVIEVIE